MSKLIYGRVPSCSPPFQLIYNFWGNSSDLLVPSGDLPQDSHCLWHSFSAGISLKIPLGGFPISSCLGLLQDQHFWSEHENTWGVSRHLQVMLTPSPGWQTMAPMIKSRSFGRSTPRLSVIHLKFIRDLLSSFRYQELCCLQELPPACLLPLPFLNSILQTRRVPSIHALDIPVECLCLPVPPNLKLFSSLLLEVLLLLLDLGAMLPPNPPFEVFSTSF